MSDPLRIGGPSGNPPKKPPVKPTGETKQHEVRGTVTGQSLTDFIQSLEDKRLKIIYQLRKIKLSYHDNSPSKRFVDLLFHEIAKLTDKKITPEEFVTNIDFTNKAKPLLIEIRNELVNSKKRSEDYAGKIVNQIVKFFGPPLQEI